MKTTVHSRLSPRIGNLLAAAATVFAIGVLNPPVAPIAYAAAPAPAPAAPVPVDQQPLTLRQQIPPDITLMLDDSGSMDWDYMPDACYLYGVTCHDTSYGTNPNNGQGVGFFDSANNDALINSNNNGVYYNPTVTYTPPPQANGTPYTSYSDITSVPENGFSTSSTSRDLTNFSTSTLTGEANSDPYHFGMQYSATNTVTTTSTYSQTASGRTSCQNTCNSYGGNNCSSAYTSATKLCTFTYSSAQIFQYFQFSTGAAAGPYTDTFVATSTQGCQGMANCYLDTDTSGVVAPLGVAAGTNIANWFAYYHKRILMAKSGLMSAFATVNPSYRIGFGSIDGNNDTALSNTTGTTPNIQQVAPFDTNCAANPTTCSVGHSGTTRAAFWSWVAGESASGGTPLRTALDQVGQYYQTSQPWTTMSTDPGYGSANAPSNITCRQAYTILTTDGFWNERTAPSTPAGASNVAGPTITAPDTTTLAYSAVDPFKGGGVSGGTSLADVATYYWDHDLQPTLTNNVPTSSADPAFWQHMATFTIGLGFTPTGISPTGTRISQISTWANGGGSAISGFSWPTPASNSIYNIADLAHAGINGHGGFFSARDPATFTRGLKTALARAASRVGTGASLAANSTQLQTGTAVYQANYYTGAWKGDLKALPVDPTSGKVSKTPTWSAEQKLQRSGTTTSSGILTFPSRNIWSYNTSTKTFVAFKNTADGSGNLTVPPSLSSAQLAALGASAGTQASIVNYLRGDNTLEQKNTGGIYRSRDWALGDIVNSQPVYEGAPNVNEFVNQSFAGYTYDPNNSAATTTPFTAWAVGTTDSSGTTTASAASQRTALVWVASNDGMLHGFNASTGNEVYAYLPGALMVNSTDPVTSLSEPLANLADPAYGDTTPHQYYNDGELTIADAYVQLANDTAAQWHSILVGTSGRGPARTVYALDVTDTSNITPLWERYAGDSSSNSGYIGEMVGKPVIAQTGDFGQAPAWSVLIGNGYNSSQSTAALLQFNLADGTLYVHTAGSTTSNGLAAPVAWMDTPTSGMSDYAYAGDLFGNIWSFQLVTVTTSNSHGTTTTTNTPNTTSAGAKLFTATNSSGTAQPITGGTWAGLNPKDRSVWVFFGTGKYLTASDVTDTSVQTWYGIEAQSTAGSGPLSAYNRQSSSMVSRSIIAETAPTGTALGTRALTIKPATDDMSGKQGWFIDLVSPSSSGAVQQGERMVTPDQFQGNLLLGTTRIPRPTGDVVDPCNPAGSGWIMVADPFTGTNPQTNFFDVNGDGSVNSSDTITVNGKQVPVAGVGFLSLPNAPIFVGVDMLVSFDNGNTANLKTSASSGSYGRVSWQEITVP